MIDMKRLIELAKKIKNPDLRKKVLSALKEPSLSNKNFGYKPEDLKRLPSSLNWHHAYEGGWIDHTYSVTMLSVAVGETLHKVYGIKIDFDALIAGALLHDFGKIWNWRKKGDEWESTELTLDHSFMGVAELYAKGFPEKVIHIIASHFGDEGPTPPASIEAIVFHFVDNFDAKLIGKMV